MLFHLENATFLAIFHLENATPYDKISFRKCNIYVEFSFIKCNNLYMENIREIRFKRKIYKQMLDWKNEPNKNSALLIEGARRVGKTTVVKEFGEKEYSNYIYIDFTYASDELKKLFKQVDPSKKEIMDQFFSDLFLLVGKTLKPGDLIILDEIQFCPSARQDIKAFVQDGRYDFIETGSLISIGENVSEIQIPSEERRIEMHPLDFEEFCWAFNDDSKCDLLRNVYNNHLSISESVHQKQMSDFRLYLVLGGMPKVISLYQQTLSFLRVDKEKKDILKLYKDDLRKHDNKYGTICLPIYENMLPSLRSWSGRVKVGARNEKQEELYLRSLRDLEDSKIVNVVRKTADISFGANIPEQLSFKLYPADTGLMLSELINNGDEDIEDAYKKIRFDRLASSNLGLLYECLVCQSVVANGIKPLYHVYDLPEGDKANRYEIDFLYMKKRKIFAIEVKSTNRFTAPSISNLAKKYPQIRIEKNIVSTKPISYSDNITNIPIYMSFLL